MGRILANSSEISWAFGVVAEKPQRSDLPRSRSFDIFRGIPVLQLGAFRFGEREFHDRKLAE
jgi:hypothetical protein